MVELGVRKRVVVRNGNGRPAWITLPSGMQMERERWVRESTGGIVELSWCEEDVGMSARLARYDELWGELR